MSDIDDTIWATTLPRLKAVANGEGDEVLLRLGLLSALARVRALEARLEIAKRVSGAKVACSCDGCWACSGHETGCTCDVDWDAIAERRMGMA